MEMIKHSDEAAASTRGDEIRLLDYAAVLLHRWRTLVVCTVLAVAAGLAISLLTPPVFSSNTVLVPSPEPNDRATAMMSQLPAFMTARIGGASVGQKLVAGILDSRSLKDSVIVRVAASVPGATEKEVTKAVYKGMRHTVSTTDGSITIDVDAAKPRVAAAVAGEIPGLINQFATRLAVEAAQAKTGVLETQLATARGRLAVSEQRLMEFQQSTGAADVPEQARQGLQAAIAVEQQIMVKEVEVSRLARTLTAGHPRLRAAEGDLATMRAQLNRMTGGGADGLYPGARQLPNLRAGAAGVLREYQTDERVYVALNAELANAQINVHDGMTVVSVLDAPLVPDAPRGSLPRVLMAALILGLVLGVIVAFVREYMARVRHDPANEPFRAALDGFKGDVGGLVGRRRPRAPLAP